MICLEKKKKIEKEDHGDIKNTILFHRKDDNNNRGLVSTGAVGAFAPITLKQLVLAPILKRVIEFLNDTRVRKSAKLLKLKFITHNSQRAGARLTQKKVASKIPSKSIFSYLNRYISRQKFKFCNRICYTIFFPIMSEHGVVSLHGLVNR